MDQKEILKGEIKKVFNSNLIYILTGSGFLSVLIIGLLLDFEPLKLLLTTSLFGIFFYIFSILFVTKILEKTEKTEQNQEIKYERALYRFNLLYWFLKSKLISFELDGFKELSKQELDAYKYSLERKEIMKESGKKII